MSVEGTQCAGKALDGIRVLDFTWSVAGPTITAFLAAFGAEVIKVEWPDRPDMMRKTMIANDVPATLDSACFFATVNPGKRGLSIDMRSEEGRKIAADLIARVDMVTESFSAGVLDRWGLTYERMRELNPEIIYVSLSGFGHSGRYQSYDTWGPTAQSFNGLTGLSGLPGRSPAGIGFSYMDVMGGYHGALAAMMALYHRKKTGQGQYVDISQVESGLALSGAGMLDSTVNRRGGGRVGVPPGNRSVWPGADAAVGLRGEVGAPYNCYPTAGAADWDYCAITVLNDEHWSSLKSVMSSPAWAEEDRFATMDSRIAHQDDLDRHVAEWTMQYDKMELMYLLQARGIPAGAMQTFEQIVEQDPQLQCRDFMVELEHPLLGKRLWETPAMKLSESPASVHPTWPLLGQDNEYILKEILQMDDESINALQEAHVEWPEGTPRVIPMDRGRW
ncbi:CaiB/BaiF CoA transferase family protein [Cumulibacter soli]|uniref:CaiB/BaiF CoA transferase family protein n=1 Tax=Cumulibacter soli TaxID=2546344 RepID=UPI001068C391|nr:CoA transferase [Cumulibacter soli]